MIEISDLERRLLTLLSALHHVEITQRFPSTDNKADPYDTGSAGTWNSNLPAFRLGEINAGSLNDQYTNHLFYSNPNCLWQGVLTS
jgi:hypothetical protein